MRKVLWTLLVVGLIALTYYLFVRPYEFEVNFKTVTTPGDITETLRIWSRSLGGSSTIVKVDSFESVKQAIVLENRKYDYEWNFSQVNDSVTGVNVQIHEPDKSFLNKILVPFTTQTIEDDASTLVNNFYKALKEHLKITKVKVIGEAEVEATFCVCSALETKQNEKAFGMMRDFPLLTSFINQFNLKVQGQVMVRVNEWSHNQGMLKFDFCFPIVKSDSLPIGESIFYKEFEKQRVLKAEYHGNYITSDRAWYELIKYANEKGYEINPRPIEYFHHNPNLGMNESLWKADVFLPIVGKETR